MPPHPASGAELHTQLQSALAQAASADAVEDEAATRRQRLRAGVPLLASAHPRSDGAPRAEPALCPSLRVGPGQAR